MSKKFFIALLLLFSLSCLSAKKKDVQKVEGVLSLEQIDKIIEKTDYDTAILELNKYFEAYPKDFDLVQLRISKILKIRDKYIELATELLRVIMESPEDKEAQGALTKQLIELEYEPRDPRLAIIRNTNNLVALSRYSLIQKETATHVGKQEYSQAVKRALMGFDLYKEDFKAAYDGQVTYLATMKQLNNVQGLCNQYIAFQSRLKTCCNDFIDAINKHNDKDYDRTYQAVLACFKDYAEIRNDAFKIALYLDNAYKRTGNHKDEYCNQFFRYARDVILGWGDDPDKGILGAMDAEWNYYVELLKNVVYVATDSSVKSLAFKNKDVVFTDDIKHIDVKGIYLINKLIDYGKGINNLYALLLEGSDKNYKKPYENYLISFDYVKRLIQQFASLKVQIDNINYYQQRRSIVTNGLVNEIDRYTSELFKMTEAINAMRKDIQDHKSDNNTWASLYIARYKEAYGDGTVKSSKDKKLKDSKNVPIKINREAKRTTSGIEITDPLLKWSDFALVSDAVYDRFVTYTSLFCTSLWKYAAEYYDNQGKFYVDVTLEGLYGRTPGVVYTEEEISFRKAKAPFLISEAVVNLAKEMVNEETDYEKRYPSKALDKLKLIYAYIADSRNTLSTAKEQLSSPFMSNYEANLKSIENSYNRLGSLLIECDEFKDRSNKLYTMSLKRANEAEANIASCRRALKNEDFETAREKLQKATDLYVRSYKYNNDAALRASTDKICKALGDEIKDKQNSYIVREVRLLKNKARKAYYQGNFEIAEKALNTAKTRWFETNVEEDVEITNLIAMVDLAISMKSGRVMSPTDPLYPEMSQTLSIASQYYTQGAKLYKKGKIQEGNEKLKAASRKIDDVRLVYPSNSEAGLLSLKIQKLKDPEGFNDSLKQSIERARKEYKDPSKQKIAYNNLLDLYEISPEYPGLKNLIYDVEIEIGVRQKPVDVSSINKSQSLYSEGKNLFNNSGRDIIKMRTALAKIDEAIRLDANNEEAMLLKDEISIRLGGSASVVLSAEDTAIYNQAVMYLQTGNELYAMQKVNELLKKPENRHVVKLLDLQKRIKARIPD